jgi:hypothetical protein
MIIIPKKKKCSCTHITIQSLVPHCIIYNWKLWDGLLAMHSNHLCVLQASVRTSISINFINSHNTDTALYLELLRIDRGIQSKGSLLQREDKKNMEYFRSCLKHCFDLLSIWFLRLRTALWQNECGIYERHVRYKIFSLDSSPEKALQNPLSI